MYPQEPPSAEDRIKVRSERFGFEANLLGRRVTIFINYDNALWYWNTTKDAEEYDESFGTNFVASHPMECVRWIKSHVPKGALQDRLLEYYEWVHFPYYWERKQERDAEESEKFERRIQAEIAYLWEWRARQMELDQESSEEEPSTPQPAQPSTPSPVEIFPLEIHQHNPHNPNGKPTSRKTPNELLGEWYGKD